MYKFCLELSRCSLLFLLKWLWFAEFYHIFYFSQKKRYVKRKQQLAEIIKTHSPAYTQTNVLDTHILSTCKQRICRSGFFWLSRFPSHTWAHIKYPSSLCVCTRAYTNAHTPTTLTLTIIEKYTRQNPQPKHSLPCQQQALTVNKLENPPLPISPHTCI